MNSNYEKYDAYPHEDRRMGIIAEVTSRIRNIVDGAEQAQHRLDAVSCRLFGPQPTAGSGNGEAKEAQSSEFVTLEKVLAQLERIVANLDGATRRMEEL